MLKLTLKCHKHPGFNPLKSGPQSIKGGCDLCFALYTLVAEMQRIKRLPATRYWDGLGNIHLPLALLLKPKKRTDTATLWKPESDMTGILFENK